MNPQKNNMSVLAQISSWIPDRIADNLAKKYGIQTRSFGPFSHATAMMYAHLAHSLSLNDLCDDLHNHAGTLEQIRGCTPPSRNGLSYANRTRNANMAQDLFWATYESLEKRFPEFLTTSRNAPGLPYRFKNRTVRAVDSTTISLTAGQTQSGSILRYARIPDRGNEDAFFPKSFRRGKCAGAVPDDDRDDCGLSSSFDTESV